MIENIDDEILDANDEVINDIQELNYKDYISPVLIKCNSIFMQDSRTIENINCKNLMLNMQYHEEGDNLYHP